MSIINKIVNYLANMNDITEFLSKANYYGEVANHTGRYPVTTGLNETKINYIKIFSRLTPDERSKVLQRVEEIRRRPRGTQRNQLNDLETQSTASTLPYSQSNDLETQSTASTVPYVQPNNNLRRSSNRPSSRASSRSSSRASSRSSSRSSNTPSSRASSRASSRSSNRPSRRSSRRSSNRPSRRR